ncbi:ABC transporter ATP-binding protein [Natranaerobius thermophilus]|uniref:Oligopeptide/dipeptide ABC transporter, ATPase subunit n=1 Tax=Natranaerobius thermophilus (strain ATCC BAA-1301 / DSM 18059 / JW/NM-WN-LF) TaxID=457570 RepID=B2A0S7_NATTJ|nr:ABC transporter ATP-binding protein [Natranaerobius thermophilus]ACB85957.1 oligopeptide/dipeptide ABC transporter, ATPase subunit [Natranaerobius thermophilus JW/NM-WN-LF]
MKQEAKTDINQSTAGSNEIPAIEVKNLKKYFPLPTGLIDTLLKREKKSVKAVDNISFSLKEGEILGLAGESGSGKTTTGELITQLQDPTEGDIIYQGNSLHKLGPKELKEFRKYCQMIFQDPYETLNPRFTIKRTIEEPLLINGWKSDSARLNKVKEALYRAELRPPEAYMNRFPHELSGGQRQRVAIARGIVLDPRILVADEPVSMLDVSIRAGILNLLKDFRDELGLSMLYISHDLSTMKYICDRTMIMYLGKAVEIGPTEKVIDKSVHPYTQALISSVPIPDPDIEREGTKIKGEIPDQINLPQGCRFVPRCPDSEDQCHEREPELVKVGENQDGEGHYAACIHADA